MAVRRLTPRIIDLLGERTKRAGWRTGESPSPPRIKCRGVYVAGMLECLVPARLGSVEPPPKPISNSRKVGSPVIEDLILESVEIPLCLLDPVVGGESEEEPIPAPHRRSVGESVVHPYARSYVVLVVGPVAWQRRPAAGFLRLSIRLQC